MPIKFYKSKILNQSNVAHDYAKIQVMPSDVKLVGFRKHARQGQGGTEFEEQIMYNVPCGLHLDFERWALGYSYPFPLSTFPQASNFVLSRIIPAQHPLKPWLYAVAVEMTEGHGALGPDQYASGQYPDGSQMNIDVGTKLPVPFGGNTQNQTFPVVLEMSSYVDASNATDGYVAMTVTYAALPYRVVNDDNRDSVTGERITAIQGNQPPASAGEMRRWVERRFDLNIQRLPLPSSELVFDDNNLPQNAANLKPGQPQNGSVIPASSASVLIPIADVVWTWYQVPDLNWDEWSKHIGKINFNWFDGLIGDNFGPHAPGTLLLHAPKVRESRMRSVNGRPLWDVTFHCQKQIGFAGPAAGVLAKGIPGGVNEGKDGWVRTWNHFPAADGGFYLGSIQGTANPNLGGTGTHVYLSSGWDKLFTIPNTTSNQYD